ncbi:hypothetical protein CDAR_195141 [Caerostris darwini]|uniref:Uncharacterized protein n=1 Tax=Caerostris darwini TaxID=1538125 RepID=A0AAV4X5N4_9ARAC|nr:hypothetical protein CDAR_195141 [Caerostris darwini]
MIASLSLEAVQSASIVDNSSNALYNFSTSFKREKGAVHAASEVRCQGNVIVVCVRRVRSRENGPDIGKAGITSLSDIWAEEVRVQIAEMCRRLVEVNDLMKSGGRGGLPSRLRAFDYFGFSCAYHAIITLGQRRDDQ